MTIGAEEYRRDPSFSEDYEFTDRASGTTHRAPFPVTVFGTRNEFFGEGSLIGSIDGNPVIQIEDCDDGKPYCVMGYESWWCATVPDEIAAAIASGATAIDSVRAYRQAQDDRLELAQMEDRDFLSDNGIAPDID